MPESEFLSQVPTWVAKPGRRGNLGLPPLGQLAQDSSSAVATGLPELQALCERAWSSQPPLSGLDSRIPQLLRAAEYAETVPLAASHSPWSGLCLASAKATVRQIS